MNRKELLALPKRDWKAESTCDMIMLVPTGKKHDSGYAIMAVIEVTNNTPTQIAGYCDHVEWRLDSKWELPLLGLLNCDMTHPTNIIRLWPSVGKLHIGRALSTVTVTIGVPS